MSAEKNIGNVGIESGIHLPSESKLLDKNLQAYATSPDFSFTVERINSFLESRDVEGVVELIKLGSLKPVEVKKIIEIYENDRENREFVDKLKKVLLESMVFEHFFDVEDEIMLVSTGSDLHSLMISGVKGFNIETLQSLLQLYKDGRQDPGGCKEKIESALKFA